MGSLKIVGKNVAFLYKVATQVDLQEAFKLDEASIKPSDAKDISEDTVTKSMVAANDVRLTKLEEQMAILAGSMSTIATEVGDIKTLLNKLP
jgi:hypothetical protein